MKLLIIILLILTHQAVGQTIDKKTLSEKYEKEAWELFFDENYTESETKFRLSIEQDSSNLMNYLGLNYISAIHDEQYDFRLLELASNGDEEKEYGYGMMTAAMALYYEQPKQSRKDQFDFRISEVQAFHMDGKFEIYYGGGILRETGEYRNQNPVGKWEHYRITGEYIKAVEYPDTGNIVLFRWYTFDGLLAKEEYVEVEDDIEWPFRTIIYWQDIPRKYGEYLFVSKDGFCVYDRDNPVEFDSSTPDNIIEEKYDKEKGRIWYIWKSGQREIYRECEFDDVEGSMLKEGEWVKYVWKNCERLFIDPEDK